MHLYPEADIRNYAYAIMISDPSTK